MGMLAVTGAKCTCPFGTTPCTLQVTSQMTCLADGRPIATIQDMQPGMNLPTFGMCSSLANPAVATATAAGTWIASNPKVLISGVPCLTSDATLVCGFGAGTISIVDPGQTKTIV